MSDFPPGYSDVPPRSGDLFDPGIPPPGRDPEAARGRVRGPAIFLIVVGALNVLAALWQLFNGAVLLMTTPAKVHDETVQTMKSVADALFQDPDARQKFVEAAEKQDPQTQYTQGLVSNLGAGIVWTVLSLVTLFGAFRMMALRNYGLAVTGAIVAAVPCISGVGACCFIGEIAGIWALIVLFNSDVRSAFH